MRIALGYVLTFGWVFLMLGLTKLMKDRRRLPDEASRKIIHVAVAFAWIPMYLCFGASWHLAVPPAAFIVLNYISYRRDLFSAMERSDSEKKSLGTVYYAVSMAAMALCARPAPALLPCYGAALFCMALGDGFAPWFGSLRRGNRVLFGSRTLYGSLSVFCICLAVLGVFAGLFALPLTAGELLLTALAAVALELVGVKGFDNLTLPLGVFALLALFTLG